MANFWRHVKHYFTSGSGIRRLDLLILYVLFVFIGFLAFNAVQAGSERALKIAVSTRSEVAEHERILSVDITGPNTALVKLNCAIAPRFFTDYLSLIKLDGRWQVINKTFVAETLPA